jgi:hypothetical protein
LRESEWIDRHPSRTANQVPTATDAARPSSCIPMRTLHATIVSAA